MSGDPSKRGRTRGVRERAATDPQSRLLDDAERLFAEHGFSGTSVRDISAASGVNQALIAYYFGGKEGLYRAVFERRGRPMMAERSKLLAQARVRAGTRPIPLRELIHAFVYPPLRMASADGPGARAFVKLQARLRHEPKMLERQLRTLHYDTTTRAFAKEMQRTLPDLGERTVLWRLAFLMGIYVHIASHTGGLAVLSRGRATTADFAEALAQLVVFAEAGFVATPPVPVATPPVPVTTPPVPVTTPTVPLASPPPRVAARGRTRLK